MTRQQLIALIKERQSFLCIGLDTDPERLPAHLKDLEDPVFEFNKAIIDATRHLCVAYKPNIAFYESLGPKGWISLEKTIRYIGDSHFLIADAKRGDIGNTTRKYARTFFEYYNFDAVTVAPYMGNDSVKPFLEFKDKWAIILALTSNEGALDFQFLPLFSNQTIYQKVLDKSQSWGTTENLMFVVGATRSELLSEVRELVPDHFLLIPGVGAQGGSLASVAAHGFNKDCGLLVNVSRSVIYASSGQDFAEAAAKVASGLQQEMADILKEKNLS